MSKLLPSLGHTGRRVVLGHTLNILWHVITKKSHNVLSKFTILCWAGFTVILGHLQPTHRGLDTADLKHSVICTFLWTLLKFTHLNLIFPFLVPFVKILFQWNLGTFFLLSSINHPFFRTENHYFINFIFKITNTYWPPWYIKEDKSNLTSESLHYIKEK